jgi:lipopolysaccharide/colanic/teichoic acid biosynthesis glycosyltransferase
VRSLIIGNGKAAESIIHTFKNTGSRFQPIAILSPYGGGKEEILSVPVLGKLNALESVVNENNIDAIFQTEAGEQTINLLLFSEGKFLEFHICPEIFGAFRNTLISEKIAGMPFLGQNISPLFGWGQVIKRTTDIGVSALFLLLFFPIFLFKKIQTKKMATGPDSETFQKYEFSQKNGFFTYLPECINVFRGEMSLVGPRPRSPQEREVLKLHERRRLAVKPGIFGLWQLERLYGKNDNIKKAIELDTKYILYWSYWKDIKILFKSIFLIATHIFRKKR